MPPQRINRQDIAIERLAARQHGVVGRARLVRLGVAVTVIDDLLRARRLRTIYRGVYTVGPKLMPLAREMAAVLACGAGTVLSHASAGKLWELLPHLPSPDSLHVSVPARTLRHRVGLRIHRVTAFLPSEVTTKHGIPMTSPERRLSWRLGV
jgi:hypothetical protein